MKRSTAAAVLVLAPLLAGGLAACAAYRAQHAASPPAPLRPATEPATAPAGRDFLAQDDPARVARLRGELAATKDSLTRAGQYRCCIRPTCDLCAMHDGKCTCRDVIEMMGPGCGECLEGWLAGRGAVPGVDIRQVLKDRLGPEPVASPPGHR